MVETLRSGHGKIHGFIMKVLRGQTHGGNAGDPLLLRDWNALGFLEFMDVVNPCTLDSYSQFQIEK